MITIPVQTPGPETTTSSLIGAVPSKINRFDQEVLPDKNETVESINTETKESTTSLAEAVPQGTTTTIAGTTENIVDKTNEIVTPKPVFGADTITSLANEQEDKAIEEFKAAHGYK